MSYSDPLPKPDDEDVRYLPSSGAMSFFFFAFLLSLPALYAMAEPFWLVVLLLPTAGIIACLHALLPWVKRRQITPRRFIARWRFFLYICACLFALPVHTANVIVTVAPLAQPQVVFSNGEKTVIFQGMIHIGAGSFYEGVAYEMREALAEGYTIFYEGVGDGTAANRAAIYRLLGMAPEGDISEEYSDQSVACGLRYQGDLLTEAVIGAEAGRLRVVDSDFDRMIAEWNRLQASDRRIEEAAIFRAPRQYTGSEAENLIDRVYGQIAPGRVATRNLFCQALLSLIFNNSDAGVNVNNQQIYANDASQLFFDLVIVDYRDRYLVEQVLSAPESQIMVVYGSGHLSGFARYLRAADPRWQVVEASWRPAIDLRQTPREWPAGLTP